MVSNLSSTGGHWIFVPDRSRTACAQSSWTDCAPYRAPTAVITRFITSAEYGRYTLVSAAGVLVAALAGLVLLAGCVTLMALVLVHYERRRRELAIRLALGASRGRLAIQLSGELLSVAAAGTAAAGTPVTGASSLIGLALAAAIARLPLR